MRTPLRITALTIAVALAVTACGSDNGDESAGDEPADSIIVYSGRSEELIAPLIEAFEAESGIDVDVRYDDSANLALLVQTEGENSPADVFISQSPGALGLLAGEDRLIELDDELLELVPEGLRADDGTWVGITGRVRVVVYNEELVEEGDLPESVLDLTDPAYDGRVAVAPTNGSFQDFVTAMRNELGDEATLEWLEGMAANGAPNYEKNSAIVEAVGRGEVDMGLVNHYYNLRALEADGAVPSRNHFLPPADIGSVVIVTGGAVLDTSDAQDEGQALLAYLLSADAQETFVVETQEYALSSEAPVTGPEGAPALTAFTVDTIDYDLLGDGLTGTLDLIRESGIEQ